MNQVIPEAAVDNSRMTITEFLEARIAEDEASANAATPGPWRYDPMKVNAVDRSESVFAGLSGGRAITVASTGPADDAPSMDDAAHIARHDPARVLAECAAKRAIIAEHPQAKQDDRPQFANEPAECLTCYAMRDTGNGIENAKSPCPTLRAIADVYASHPDYQQEWAK